MIDHKSGGGECGKSTVVKQMKLVIRNKLDFQLSLAIGKIKLFYFFFIFAFVE